MQVHCLLLHWLMVSLVLIIHSAFNCIYTITGVYLLEYTIGFTGVQIHQPRSFDSSDSGDSR